MKPGRKLTRDEILKLSHGYHHFWIRFWRLWEPEPVLQDTAPTELEVIRVPAKRRLPERMLFITHGTRAWAEADENDVQENGNIVVEDYMLELFEIG